VIVADQSAVNHPRIKLQAGLAAVVDDDQMFNGIVNGLQAPFQ
jgi:phosphotransferase system IIB component